MNEETEVYVKMLRAIADSMEQRGIEPDSVSMLDVVGTTELTQPDDKVRHFKGTRERFFSIAWRYAEHP